MPHGLTKETIDKIKGVFSRFGEVEEAILYGSRAKGNYKPGSDIDLTLQGKELELRTINKISILLDDLLLPYSIDISIFYQISNPDVIEHIERVGLVFYKKKEE